MVQPTHGRPHDLAAVCTVLQDRIDALARRLEALRMLCGGCEPEDWIAHMKRENRELREERGRHVYDRPSEGWE